MRVSECGPALPPTPADVLRYEEDELTWLAEQAWDDEDEELLLLVRACWCDDTVEAHDQLARLLAARDEDERYDDRSIWS